MLEVQQMRVSSLKPWQDNPRLNDHAVDAVARSIKSFGFNVPILCDQNSTIIAGHTRWKAAKKLGMKSVPVLVLEMTETQRKAYSVADNKTAQIAEWDYPQLREVLEELRCDQIDLSSLGYSASELDALLREEEDFDWKAFEEQLTQGNDSKYVYIQVKIETAMKESFSRAIKKYATKHEIKEKDSAQLAGRVFGSLLGLTQ